MSYCHITLSTQKVLQFHPIVEQQRLDSKHERQSCYTLAKVGRHL